MSANKIIIEKYIEGFRRSDHVQILSCLSDDIVWVLHGYKTLKGKDAFDAEIENEDFEGNPALTIDRMIEEGDSVVVTGSGSVTRRGGERLQFKFSEVFTFSGDAISRLETYHIWLGRILKYSYRFLLVSDSCPSTFAFVITSPLRPKLLNE